MFLLNEKIFVPNETWETNGSFKNSFMLKNLQHSTIKLYLQVIIFYNKTCVYGLIVEDPSTSDAHISLDTKILSLGLKIYVHPSYKLSQCGKVNITTLDQTNNIKKSSMNHAQETTANIYNIYRTRRVVNHHFLSNQP